MKNMRNRKVSEEDKQQVVQNILDKKIDPTIASQVLGVKIGTVYQWVTDSRKAGAKWKS